MHHKVIIIGAGVAGCSAAKALADANFEDFIVLEASDRIGGRVKTEKTKHGFNMEHGAAWLHGADRNPLYKELADLCLLDDLSDSITGNVRYFTADGKRVNQGVVEKSYEIYEHVSSKIPSDWKSSECSLEDFKKDEFKKICTQLNIPEESIQFHEAMSLYMEKMYSIIEGIWPYDRSSLVNSDIYDYCGYKNFALKYGTYSIFEKFLLPKIQDKIFLKKEVKTIVWDSPDKLTVVTGSGTFTADHVILTPSLGFIKQHHKMLLNPTLPADKVEAIENMYFGKIEKIHLLFDEAFWATDLKAEPDFKGYAFIYGDHEMAELADSIEKIIGCKDRWWTSICVFQVSILNPHLSTCWLSGEPAVSMNRYSDDEVRRVILTILKHFTGIEVASPCTVVRTSWSSEKYILGSYSAVTKDYKRSFSNSMLEPLYQGNKPVLLFAGEAYHPSFMSTMHGAYSTGQKQANEVMAYIKTQTEESL